MTGRLEDDSSDWEKLVFLAKKLSITPDANHTETKQRLMYIPQYTGKINFL